MTKKINSEVPVLVVGGGGAGLTASLLLSRFGVGTLLVNRYPETTRLPRGHILNQRTMEIFTDMGVAPDVLAKSAPPENMRGEGWYSGLGGGGPADGHGRRVGFVEGWGGGFSDPDYLAASACAATNLSLLNVEPILKAHAERHPKATVRFHQELVDLEQDADGVTSTVLDCGSGETYTVRSAYVLGADAGRTVGDLVGITVDRSPKVRKLTSIHMSADLSPYLQEADDAVLLFIINPEHPEHLDFGGVLIPQGPRWGRYSEGWVLAVSGDHLDISKPEDMLRRAREVLGIPDLDATIHRASEWHVESLLADEFQAGRVFLLGDAAHKIPPVGGLGLNSAVHDAYNLCWKLAMVHAGRAGDSLLDTYTVERRPVNQANSEASNRGWAAQAGMTEALGVSPDKSVEENWSALRMFWEDVPGAAERRHAFTKWASGKTLELRQHNTDFGYAYDSVAIVGDGTPAPAPVDDVRLYQPGTRPGQPLPHAWVEHAGERVALRSLIHGGHFALIAGEDGQEWVEAAAKIAEQRHIPLRTARVGLGDVDLVDVRLAWLKQREISRTGAVLVRPDGHIGFRSFAAVEDPLKTLAAVFTDILHTTTVE